LRTCFDPVRMPRTRDRCRPLQQDALACRRSEDASARHELWQDHLPWLELCRSCGRGRRQAPGLSDDLFPRGNLACRSQFSNDPAELLGSVWTMEAELVAFIGKKGRHISRADALSHVAGYSIFNDGSIRELSVGRHPSGRSARISTTPAVSAEFVSAERVPSGAAD